MTPTAWHILVPDALVPIDETQTYDSSTNSWDDTNDSWDGSYTHGYQVVWTVTTS